MKPNKQVCRACLKRVEDHDRIHADILSHGLEVMRDRLTHGLCVFNRDDAHEVPNFCKYKTEHAVSQE
jgi:hypothetical protein